MTDEQGRSLELEEKITRLGYPKFEILPGIDDLPMVHIDGHLICGIVHATMISDDELKWLIDETLRAAGGQG